MRGIGGGISPGRRSLEDLDVERNKGNWILEEQTALGLGNLRFPIEGMVEVCPLQPSEGVGMHRKVLMGTTWCWCSLQIQREGSTEE